MSILDWVHYTKQKINITKVGLEIQRCIRLADNCWILWMFLAYGRNFLVEIVLCITGSYLNCIKSLPYETCFWTIVNLLKICTDISQSYVLLIIWNALSVAGNEEYFIKCPLHFRFHILVQARQNLVVNKVQSMISWKPFNIIL